MPLVTKGGKYIYAWTKVHDDGTVYLPEEALNEYNIERNASVHLMSGSKISKGFSILSKELLHRYDSHMLEALQRHPDLFSHKTEGMIVKDKGRVFSSVHLGDGNCIRLSPELMRQFGIQPGVMLLSIRSSNVAFVNILEGPIVERAKTHGEIMRIE